MATKLGLADNIKVVLTETGINELHRRRQHLNEYISKTGGKPVGPYEIKVDDDGYTQFPFWVFMNNLGHLMGTGTEMPIKGDIIILDK